MKTIMALVLGVLLSSASAWAYQDGEYRCQNDDGTLVTVMKIKTVTFDGVEVPFLQITKTQRDDVTAEETTSQVKGFASHSSYNGQETLVLGHTKVELENGRPACAK